ncbi:MAG: PAS domain S-box protein [Deltaproteobacteria bacterium]|nr:PAS domain S-box protein [Deltaproteobacteria bacterium]
MVADRSGPSSVLRLFAEHSPAAIAMFDRDMRYIVATKRYLTDYRLVEQDLTGRSHYEVFPEIPERWKEIHRRCLAGAVERAEDDRFVREDGTVDCVRWEIRPWYDDHGAVGGLILFSEVLTEQKRAEEALRQSEARFRATFEQAAVGIAHVSPDGSWLRVNQKLCDIVGYTREELLQRTFQDITHPDDLDRDLAFVRQVLAGDLATYTMEKRYRKKDGAIVWIELTVSLVRTPSGEPDYFISVVNDIDARKRAEQALAAKTAELESYFDDALDLLCIVDVDGRLRRMNKAWAAFLGTRREDLEGRHFADFLHPDDIEPALRAQHQLLATGALESFSARCRCSDGSYRWVELRSRFAGDTIHVTARDITEQRLARESAAVLEEQLRVAQKMDAIGKLAGGVAHDFNNLLSVMLGYTTFAVDALREGDPLRSDLKEVLDAGNRAAALTRQLLAFSRRQVLELEVLDVNAVAVEMEKMLSRLIGEHVRLELALDPALGTVKADKGQLEQVLMNLVVNARDAMLTGGTVTVRTASAAADQCPSGLGPCVVLTVSDTGSGMDAATRARLFEPFFTTKERGKGTGLGLSTVYGIVKQSGGDVTVESEPGHGSTFRVFLPRADRPLSMPRTMTPTPRPTTGTETVLLVEDEEAVRRLTTRLLLRAGFNVLTAQHGGEALLLCERHVGDIHLVLTDVVMPQMSGPELAARLHALRPGLKVLYMSGYTDQEVGRHGLLEAGSRLIAKPFTAEILLRRLRDVLDETAAP